MEVAAINKIYFGFDPGITGAFARLHNDNYEVWHYPKKKNNINFIKLVEEISEKIAEVYDTTGANVVVIAVEEQHFFSDDGKGAVWTAAMRYGMLFNALAIVNKEYPLLVKVVKATKWKARFDLLVKAQEVLDLGTVKKSKIKRLKKEKTALEVLRRYPKADIYGPLNGLHDGKADALMIATWLKETQEENE